MKQDPINSVYQWANRIEYSGNDLVICLGGHVKECFNKFKRIPFKFLPHPSSQWSNESKANYVKRAIDLILAA